MDQQMDQQTKGWTNGPTDGWTRPLTGLWLMTEKKGGYY